MAARILVVDDNSANLELMVYLLKAFGHVPVGVSNAADGLRRLGDGFDLILTDIRMPEIDGYEFAKRARATDSNAPIVAVTAHAMVGDRERVLASGFNGYIPKPIEPANFVGQVDAFLAPNLRSRKP